MKTEEMRNKIMADTLSKKGDIYTARKGFFYSHGGSSEIFANRIKDRIPNVIIIDHGEQWKPFRGGASVAQSTHWWVKFKIVTGVVADMGRAFDGGLPSNLRL